MTVRCFICGTRRATFLSLLKHRRDKGHDKPCLCGGYPFPHRPGSPTCDSNPYVRSNRALREGATEDDWLEARIDDILFNEHKPITQKEAPF